MNKPEKLPLETIDGPVGAIHVDDGGKGGVPVLFVHSYAGDASHWRAQLEHLREKRRAVAFDLRGHGGSAKPAANDYEAGSLAQDIAAVADALGLKKFFLVGHSIGGSAAGAYAGEHPERVAGLVLAGAPGKIPKEQGEKIMASIEADYDKVMKGYWEKLLANAKDETRAKVEEGMKSLSKEASLALIRASMFGDPLPALRKYDRPILVISTASGDTPNDLQNLLPNATNQSIAGTSHWMQMDKPDEFNAALDAFLKQHE
jgi:pimeloyl-ACP methyl ester carboxylesterase